MLGLMQPTRSGILGCCLGGLWLGVWGDLGRSGVAEPKKQLSRVSSREYL